MVLVEGLQLPRRVVRLQADEAAARLLQDRQQITERNRTIAVGGRMGLPPGQTHEEAASGPAQVVGGEIGHAVGIGPERAAPPRRLALGQADQRG